MQVTLKESLTFSESSVVDVDDIIQLVVFIFLCLNHRRHFLIPQPVFTTKMLQDINFVHYLSEIITELSISKKIVFFKHNFSSEVLTLNLHDSACLPPIVH